jgi:glycosyltransferase involved in cell wall biosynthesis
VDYASPLKLFEYLAVGLPIIAPDLPNIREVLTNAHNALLFDEGDAGDFVRCLSQMCNDSALRSRLSASAAATIAGRGLTWRHNAERVTELATGLLEA